MAQFFLSRERKTRGFTLIEIILVAVAIGILIAIIVSAFNRAQ